MVTAKPPDRSQESRGPRACGIHHHRPGRKGDPNAQAGGGAKARSNPGRPHCKRGGLLTATNQTDGTARNKMTDAARFEHPLLNQVRACGAMREELEREHPGRWVIISEARLIGDPGSFPLVEGTGKIAGHSRLIAQAYARLAETEENLEI